VSDVNATSCPKDSASGRKGETRDLKDRSIAYSD